ncbi:MAG: SusC/RagA family TonB-linked outer membrane protein [Gemmatimonadota bacterium]
MMRFTFTAGTIMYCLRRGIFLLALLLAMTDVAVAQLRVRGRVTGAGVARNEPSPGVTGRLAGTSRGVVTDAQGEYIIAVPTGVTLLEFSSIGFRTQQVTINGREVIDLTLEPMVLNLEGLVVVGYMTQQRRDVSGSVGSLTGAEIAEQQVATLEQALRGRLAGVNVVSSGEPGRASAVVVRGQNFIGNVSPLYVVDGLYMRQNPGLNPDDIESIEILKDASAASQYGAQAANGVIVITTRRGRAGETRLAIRSSYGFQEVPKTIEMMDAAGWARITNMARANAGLPPIPAAQNLPAGVDVDWQDAVLERGALQDHNVTVSGGSASASYLLSGGFLRQDGTIMKTGFERANLRLNSDLRRGRLTVGENFAISRIERSNLAGFPLIDAMRMQPTIPIRDPNDPARYGYGSDANPTFGTNPVGSIERTDNTDEILQAMGTVYAELDLLDHLKYRLNLGANQQNINWRNFVRQRQVRQNTVPEETSLTDRRDNITSTILENLLTYTNTFGEHDINAMAGYTEQREQFQRLEAFRRGFPDENLPQIDAGSSQFDNRGFKIENALRSYLFRANYSFDHKYLFTGSFRRDGSSRFGPDNRYGNFASASVGWLISEEPFFQSLPLLGGGRSDYFKLRASRGKLGNQDIGDYQFAAAIVGNQSYPFGNDQIAVGQTQLSLANPGIRWQDNTQTNVGFDLGFMDSRLMITADYYVSESGGLLVRAPLPWSLGSLQAPFVNAGSVQNKGFELSASLRQKVGELELDVGANFTTISNKVTALGNGGQPIFAGPFGAARTTVGSTIGHFFVLKTDGLFQSEQEVAEHGAQPNAKPGDVRFIDLNDDGLINDLDRYDAGSAVPDFEAGMTVDAKYRRFDFGIAVRGSRGARIFNVAKFWSDRMDEGSNYRADLDPWTPDNRAARDPRAVWGPAGNNNKREASDRWIEDGSYLRIQSLTAGVLLPEAWLQRVGVTNGDTRFYLSVQNLHTFTGFSNWDPEALGFNDPLARGFDDGRIYPNPRTVTFGIDVRM